jgi:hypothetical protein
MDRSKEFIDRVLPHKRILPKELYKDLLNIFLNPSNPDSKPSDKLTLGISYLIMLKVKNIVHYH